MARTWRDYPAEALPSDSSDSSDSPPNDRELTPNGANGPNGKAIPPIILRGLAWLENAPAPRVRCPEAWPGVVADALRMARDGWAEQALALGWTELDLFGAVPDRHGDPAGDGLAVKLSGRKLLAICASFATVQDHPGGRSFLYRSTDSGAVLLWEIGRGR